LQRQECIDHRPVELAPRATLQFRERQSMGSASRERMVTSGESLTIRAMYPGAEF
jgi:hypothetical protein